MIGFGNVNYLSIFISEPVQSVKPFIYLQCQTYAEIEDGKLACEMTIK